EQPAGRGSGSPPTFWSARRLGGGGSIAHARSRFLSSILRGFASPGSLGVPQAVVRAHLPSKRRGRSMRPLLTIVCLAGSTRVDRHDLAEQFDGLVVRTLEGVASHDRAEAAAFVDAFDLGQQLLVAHRRAAGENHDALAIEGALDNVADAVR